MLSRLHSQDTQGADMNIYEAIKDDHDRMRGLLRELKKAVEDGGDEPGRLFDELKRQLRSHEAAEETAFYEPLKRADETRREVLDGQEAARLGEAWLRRKRDALDAVAPVKRG